jgi:hypothetical protein
MTVRLGPDGGAAGVADAPQRRGEGVPLGARLSFRFAMVRVAQDLWPDLRWEALGELASPALTHTTIAAAAGHAANGSSPPSTYAADPADSQIPDAA